MLAQLDCVIVDSGPAAYLKPVVTDWLRDPPPFEWSIRLGEKAARLFGETEDLDGHRGADVSREDSAPDWNGDAVLVSAGGWPVERALVRAGRTRGMPTIQFVDSCYNYRRRLCEDGIWTLPDLLFLVTESSVVEAVAEGVPAEICRSVGHPLWEQVTPGVVCGASNVLFVGAPVARDYGASLGYTETDAWRMLQDVWAGGVDGWLHYAPHPEQDPACLPADAELVAYDPTSLDRYETFIGMFSAPLVDAYLAGRRSISLQPGAVGDDMFFLSRQGYLPRATDRASLAAALAVPPPDPSAFASEMHGSARRLNLVLHKALAL